MSFSDVLKNNTYKWTVTGCAGFIGSHLSHFLLSHDQKVIGLDNFATGFRENIEAIKEGLSPNQIDNFRFIEGDIRDKQATEDALKGQDFVLHQAALGSVPRSIENPIETQDVNVSGFLNVLYTAYKCELKNFVYASSSSVYGDSKADSKAEKDVGSVLSPYALTKKDNEQWASVFSKCYNFSTTGLRYFNVFGPRQSEKSRYAAVFPKWFACMRDGTSPVIFGDGQTSRDFCFIENVIQANVLAATKQLNGDNVFNVSLGGNITLIEALETIRTIVKDKKYRSETKEPTFEDFRAGDIRHSSANINHIKSKLGYEPTVSFKQGMEKTLSTFFN